LFEHSSFTVARVLSCWASACTPSRARFILNSAS
jgi:hypothetical protein